MYIPCNDSRSLKVGRCAKEIRSATQRTKIINLSKAMNQQWQPMETKDWGMPRQNVRVGSSSEVCHHSLNDNEKTILRHR